VHVITAIKLKWQPHTSDVLTEGALTFTTIYVGDLALKQYHMHVAH
jgi:hypothetical protein